MSPTGVHDHATTQGIPTFIGVEFRCCFGIRRARRVSGVGTKVKQLELSCASANLKGTGQTDEAYLNTTQDSFKQVVQFYCQQAGFTPPTWSILGRDFPGDKIQMPGRWQGMGKLPTGERTRIALIHDIRSDVAQATFLVTNLDAGSNVCVSVSRAKDEPTTTIHILLIAKQ